MKRSYTALTKNIQAMNTFSKNLNQYYILSENDFEKHIDFPNYVKKIINCFEFSLDGMNKTSAFYKRTNKVLNEYRSLSIMLDFDRSSYDFTKQYYTVKKALDRVSEIYTDICTSIA